MYCSLTPLVKNDLDFIIAIHDKLKITPVSWYWRTLTESEDEWIMRRVELSKERKMIEGYLLNNERYIKYMIPNDSSQCTIHVGRDSNMKEVCIEHNELYNTLEELFTHS